MIRMFQLIKKQIQQYYNNAVETFKFLLRVLFLVQMMVQFQELMK